MFTSKKLTLSATFIVIVTMLFSTNVVKSQVFDIFNTSGTKLARVGMGDPTGIKVSTTTGKPDSTLSILTFGQGDSTAWPWGVFCHENKKLAFVRNWNGLYFHQMYLNDNGKMAINVPLPMPPHALIPSIPYAPTYELEVYGHVRCSTLTYFSDSRLKDNIQAIPVTKVADLYKVGAVQYTSSTEILKQQQKQFEESNKENLTTEEIAAMRLYFDSVITERNKDTRIHYGVIAQDIKNIYPDLVYKDKQGYLSVDYTGLIPVMVEATKELNKEIKYVKEENEYLKLMLDSVLKRLDKCCPEPDTTWKDTTSKKDTTTWRDTTNRKDTTKWEEPKDTTNTKWEEPKWEEPKWEEPKDTSKWGTPKPRPQKDEGMLLGNAPNPFSDKTEIGYEIPQGTSTAYIVIYDADGNEVMRFDVSGSKGTSYLPVDGSHLKSGTYTYCLLVNGKKVECKQMVVAK